MRTLYDPRKPVNDNRKLALVADDTVRRRISQAFNQVIGQLTAQNHDAGEIIEVLYQRILDVAAQSDLKAASEFGDIRLDRYLQLSRISSDLQMRSLGLFTLSEIDEYL